MYYDETRPVVNTTAPEMRNRRAVTAVSGIPKGYSGLLKGKYAAIIMRKYVDSATRTHQTGTPAHLSDARSTRESTNGRWGVAGPSRMADATDFAGARIVRPLCISALRSFFDCCPYFRKGY